MVPVKSTATEPVNGVPGGGGGSSAGSQAITTPELGRALRGRVHQSAEVVEDAAPGRRVGRVVELGDQLELGRVVHPAAIDPVPLDVQAAEVRVVERL